MTRPRKLPGSTHVNARITNEQARKLIAFRIKHNLPTMSEAIRAVIDKLPRN